MMAEESHNCEKSEGKIFCIVVDVVGNTYCSYCNEKVDYCKEWIKKINDDITRIKQEWANKKVPDDVILQVFDKAKQMTLEEEGELEDEE